MHACPCPHNTLSSMVKGDAPVVSAAGEGTKSKAPSKKDRDLTFSERMGPYHNVSDGVFTTNRKGIALCSEFQAGNCFGIGTNARCKKDGISAHQCNKCLSPDHSPKECDRTPRQPSASSANKFARSSCGRGKGGEKAGVRRPQN